ncbi:MAG: hypothetical protein J5750_08145 [Clostridiales bacterium]|nr:hypothetical protein [Clostridiales bacterium]
MPEVEAEVVVGEEESAGSVASASAFSGAVETEEIGCMLSSVFEVLMDAEASVVSVREESDVTVVSVVSVFEVYVSEGAGVDTEREVVPVEEDDPEEVSSSGTSVANGSGREPESSAPTATKEAGEEESVSDLEQLHPARLQMRRFIEIRIEIKEE